MGQFNIVRKCFICGTFLQQDNPTEPGYISKDILMEEHRVLFCDSCFQQDTYNLVPANYNLTSDYKTMIKDALASDALIIYVIDLFSFECSFPDELTRMLEGANILVLANKRDLLPNNVDNEQLKEYVAHRLRVSRLKVKASDVIITSSQMNTTIEQIQNSIHDLRKRHDVYLIGNEGSGKTTLISALLKNYRNISDRPVKKFEYPGTSLIVMQIPLDKNSTLFDSTGIKVSNSLINHVEDNVKWDIMPKKMIIDRRFKVAKKSALLIGGLASFEFIETEPMIVHLYMSSTVDAKLEKNNKENLFFDYIKDTKILPVSQNFKSNLDFNTYELYVEETGERDIGIEGLGWISFVGNKQTIRVTVPKGVSIYTTRAKVKHVK